MVTARNARQQELINAVRQSEVTFAIGPAGSGKTFIATHLAVEALLKDKKTLYFTRPAVSSSKSVGLLPGTLEEKMFHWLRPILMVLEDSINQQDFEKLVKKKRINFLAFEHLRGLSLDNAFVILDEAQTTSTVEMKTFLTRIGENTTYVICGDIDQKEVPGLSGLEQAVQINPGYPVIQFLEDDCVRSDACKKWLHAYRNLANSQI